MRITGAVLEGSARAGPSTVTRPRTVALLDPADPGPTEPLGRIEVAGVCRSRNGRRPASAAALRAPGAGCSPVGGPVSGRLPVPRTTEAVDAPAAAAGLRQPITTADLPEGEHE